MKREKACWIRAERVYDHSYPSERDRARVCFVCGQRLAEHTVWYLSPEGEFWCVDCFGYYGPGC